MGRKSRGKKIKRMEREEAQQHPHELPGIPGAPAGAPRGDHNFSDILTTYLYPVLQPQDDIDDVRAKMTWGVMIWNKAMADAFPDHPVSEQIAEQFPLFMLMVPDEDLVTAFLARKKQEFSHDNFFILEHKAMPGRARGEFSVTVSVLPVQ